MALYTVTIRTTLHRLHPHHQNALARQRDPAELAQPRGPQLYPGCRFHGDLPGLARRLPRVVFRQSGDRPTSARVRIDTERC